MNLGEAIAVIIGGITILTALWKGFRLIDNLENKALEQQLTLNGVRERLEHVTLRLTSRLDRLESRANQFERYLSKTTDFEARD